jgi:hypothetical protein
MNFWVRVPAPTVVLGVCCDFPLTFSQTVIGLLYYLKIVAVWEQNSPDPENLSYSSGYSDAFSALRGSKPCETSL